MGRALNVRNLFAMKHELFQLDGIWHDTIGSPERNGAWLIWGSEKNGKTWFTLLLSNYLSDFEKVHYISAEEGLCSDFIDTCRRAKINLFNKKLQFHGYEPLVDLYKRLKRRQAPKIVVIDNITIYNDELKNGALRKLLNDFPQMLFIFLAHEDRGLPYTATAKMTRKIAKRIFYIEGLSCQVSGRCPGGTLTIDEERAALYHGHSILNR